MFFYVDQTRLQRLESEYSVSL